MLRSASQAGLRPSRPAAAVLLFLGMLLATSACGMNVQTNRPYTPAEGVNTDAGSVKIRNLMILTRTPGTGFLSASLLSDGQDALVAVSGTPVKADGADGAALTATVSDPVALGNGVLVVLTDRAPITVQSPDLKAGLTAKLVLQFSTAGQVNITVPVVDANQHEYVTVSPTAAPSG